jgi:hypothetical protein
MLGVPEPAEALTFSTEESPSGACGANACHAWTTSFAFDHGHSIEYVETAGAGFARKTNLVTIPKFPPPPPRSAQ